MKEQIHETSHYRPAVLAEFVRDPWFFVFNEELYYCIVSVQLAAVLALSV
jgi:hypothetical protein